jgi:hypothetical protein
MESAFAAIIAIAKLCHEIIWTARNNHNDSDFKAFYLRRIQVLPLLLLAARVKGPGARQRNEWSPEKKR